MLRSRPMSAALALALLLSGTPPDREAARLELEAVAARIAHLKERHASGQDRGHEELHRLLVRAQELAIAIDLMDHPQAPGTPPPRVRGPTADELRERADAARDEADRIRGDIEAIERRIVQIENAEAAAARVPSGNLVSTAPRRATTPPGLRIAMLEADRERLLQRLAAALRHAERLESEARVLESVP